MNLIGKETLPTLTKWEIYELERQDYSGEGNNVLEFIFASPLETLSRLEAYDFSRGRFTDCHG